MADPKHVRILSFGASQWNEWRQDHQGANSIRLDLSGADLSGRNLREVDLSEVYLTNANLSKSELQGANFTLASLDGADLREAHLCSTNFFDANMNRIKIDGADLSGASLREASLQHTDFRSVNLSGVTLRQASLQNCDLRKTNLYEANLFGAVFTKSKLQSANLQRASLGSALFIDSDLSRVNLDNADLKHANLTYTDLSGAMFKYANLQEADLTGAKLIGSDFSNASLAGTILNGADLSEAILSRTVLCNTLLNDVRGLDKVNIRAECCVDHLTLQRAKEPLHDNFLGALGLADWQIEESKLLRPNLTREDITNISYEVIRLRGQQPIQLHSTFISYSHKDEAFAQLLYEKLRKAGVKCFYAPEDLKIGDRLRNRIDEVIQIYDKTLVVLSENSVRSNWVENEVETALEAEATRGISLLFPIKIDDAVHDIEAGWAASIRRTRHIGDFLNWQNSESFDRAIAKILRDLRT